MHELGIATSIFDRVKQTAAAHPGATIQTVAVRVGELSGVDPDALAFAFEVVVKDTPYEGVLLEIEWLRRVQRCRGCGHTFATDAILTECPKCASLHTETIAGDELDIAFVELEEAACS